MEKFIPIIGVILEDGRIESYDYNTALKNRFHHSFIMSLQDKKEMNYDNVLRFVKLGTETFYTLEGEPALDPHTVGKKQIRIFAAHCVENGVDPKTRVKIKDHKLGTYYEGKFIGYLKDFLK